MEPFDIVHHPLMQGSCLIEAGAGTGKTYALTAIFLRLLIEKQVEPERILVVTFTTAATAELRERLRRQLVAVRRFIDGEGPLDDTLKQIIAPSSAAAVPRQRVVAALQAFDHFAVFTIHGFCQRLLAELAFETASPFELELVTDPSAWIQSIADDYWREIFVDAPPELADYALAKLHGPESLAALYQQYGMLDLHLMPQWPQSSRVDFGPYRRRCADLRRQWPAVCADVEALLQSPALKGNVYGSLKPAVVTKRAQKVAGWCRTLASFLLRDRPIFPPAPVLTYFTTAKIAASTRKGQTTPRHVFFDDCQDLHTAAAKLQEELDEWVTALRVGFFAYASRKLKQQKQERQAVFYDDLLIQVRRALDGPNGNRLAAAVRRRYQVALVDEFQDTDTTQYHIFKRLFGAGEHLLFMIGDPKQAIYGFRGADIFSYLKAARQAAQQRTLVQNWRSQPGLIQAINTLFEHRPHPFLIPQITYHPAVAASGQETAAAGRSTDSPMILWWMPPGDDGAPDPVRPMTTSRAVQKIMAAIAVEVKRLLDPPADDKANTGAWSARDMAVLVRTNRQARTVKAFLQEAGIPAVIQNAGNVFDTPEAGALEHVLQAVIHPGDTKRLKSALATRFFGFSGDRLAAAEQGTGWLEEERKRFFSYLALWQKSGFYPFFRRMLSENRIAENLLRLTDGERRLTNLLHLGELLHQASVSMRGALREVLKWLDRQIIQLGGRRDEHLLRMESDAQALTILTVHKSKGLEFPIVFSPFSWQADGGRDDWPLFHDRHADMRRTLDLRISSDPDHQNQARQERLAESLRLLYVAVTRAKMRCYLVWTALPSAGASALGYLLAPPAPALDREQVADLTPAESDGAPATPKPAHGLDRLVNQSGGTIAVRPLADSVSRMTPHENPAPDLAPERYWQRRLVSHWAITSFSALTRGAATSEPSSADHDQRSAGLVAKPIDFEKDRDAAKLADDIHLFPRGRACR